MVTETLTGRTRVRPLKRWFRAPLLIMQVEVHRKGTIVDSRGESDAVDFTEWRDAVVEDFHSDYMVHYESTR